MHSRGALIGETTAPGGAQMGSHPIDKGSPFVLEIVALGLAARMGSRHWRR